MERFAGGGATTWYVTEAGVAVFPAASIAFTVKVCEPAVEVLTGLLTVPVFRVPGGKVAVPHVTTPEFTIGEALSVQLYVAVTA